MRDSRRDVGVDPFRLVEQFLDRVQRLTPLALVCDSIKGPERHARNALKRLAKIWVVWGKLLPFGF